MASPPISQHVSAIDMINANCPTEHLQHINIQYFAIQEWKVAGDILMCHIRGLLNPADDLTKPLGWVLPKLVAKALSFPTPSQASKLADTRFVVAIWEFAGGPLSVGTNTSCTKLGILIVAFNLSFTISNATADTIVRAI